MAILNGVMEALSKSEGAIMGREGVRFGWTQLRTGFAPCYPGLPGSLSCKKKKKGRGEPCIGAGHGHDKCCLPHERTCKHFPQLEMVLEKCYILSGIMTLA